MKITKNTVVTISYVLRENNQDGELLEIMNEKYPFVFFFGSDRLLPAFEDNLKGLDEGDQFSFRLTADEAYGKPSEKNKVNIPIRAFEVNGEIQPDLLQINNQVNVTDDQGSQHTGTILEYDDDSVRIDFNHVMAGKNLYFEGVVMKVREATVDEIVQKHPKGDS